MDLGINVDDKDDRIRKKSFVLSQKSQRDGLILRIHHTDKKQQKLRFLHISTNKFGNLLASSDERGNLYFINITACKFWTIPPVKSCTFLAFSTYKFCEILIGLKTCEILIVNFEIGFVTGKLTGHASPPENFTFSENFCLTYSKTEAILWDLRDNSKFKILQLDGNSLLKHVSFVPNSNLILGCYTDDMMNIWDFGTFQALRSIPGTIWNNMNIQIFTFTTDGSTMIISGKAPIFAIFSLKTWKITQFINLPEHVKTIKTLKFLKNDKILGILSGDGALSFFDIAKNLIISELKTQREIVKFANTDYYIICLLCSGDVEIYDVSVYVATPRKIDAMTEKKLRIRMQKKIPAKKIEDLKYELDDALNVDKLKSILKEFGEYPENYRALIWEQLLQLPYNRDVYDGIFSYKTRDTFQDLSRDKRNFPSLRCLLNNLVTWCSFFENVDYLQVFVYPFVKIFQHRPIVCFEAVATIILNWCQYWFEYFPLPPINILAIIENILLDFDPQLYEIFNIYRVSSEKYAWILLESAFTEVLTTHAWFILWDHVLTNEPCFLLCAVVAYNISLRNILLTLKDSKDFENFYHRQNPLEIKKFISKTYLIFEKTKEEIHPRRYLNEFKKLEHGHYPIFQNYPKNIIQNETQKLKDLKDELQNIELEEAKSLLDKKKEIDRILDSDLEDIEQKRLCEMKKACNDKLQDQQAEAKEHLHRLSKLRKKFEDHQSKILKFTKSDQLRKRLITTDLLYSEIETNKSLDDFQAEKAENQLLRHYSELIKHKMQIEALLQEESSSLDEPQLHETIRREHKKILREIRKISQAPDASERIRQYNLISSLLAMDDLIKKVESALAKELTSEYLDLGKSESCLKNLQLQTETEELEAEVTNILNVLSKSKVNDGKLSADNTQASWENEKILENRRKLSSSSSNSSSLKKVKRWKKTVKNKSVKFTNSKK